MRPRNVSVSLYEQGGELRVWCASFVSGFNPDGSQIVSLAPNIFTETYLKVVDQVGVSATLAFIGRSYIEANAGYLRSYAHADRPGGSLRFVVPVSKRLAFTVEGDLNATLVSRANAGRGRCITR